MTKINDPNKDDVTNGNGVTKEEVIKENVSNNNDSIEQNGSVIDEKGNIAKDTKNDVKKNLNEKALDNKCPGCGAPIFFAPKIGKWKCEYCNSEFTIEDMQKYNNASNIKYNEDSLEEVVDDDTVYISYKCKNCGAEIVADEQTAATFCVYCGSTAILKNKLTGKFAPNLLIPFKVEKEQAIKAFQELSKGRPFVPKDFINKENIEKIRGIYIPFWLYDVEVSGTLDCNGNRVTSWTRGDTRYTKTDTYLISRTGSMKFNKVPVDGSTRFDNEIMNSIEPFNYDEMIPYNHAYLSGFLAEKYDVESKAAFTDAGNRTLNSGKDVMYNDSLGYTSKSIIKNTLTATPQKTLYAMLPVYMVSVKYKEKMYIFAMNGQTGKFIGDIPLDKGKATLWAISIFIIAFAIVGSISYFLFLTR